MPNSICERASKASLEKTLCCDEVGCFIGSPECLLPEKNRTHDLAQCRKISKMDACKRSDDIAERVCNNKDKLFCLSLVKGTGAITLHSDDEVN